MQRGEKPFVRRHTQTEQAVLLRRPQQIGELGAERIWKQGAALRGTNRAASAAAERDTVTKRSHAEWLTVSLWV